jgi:hypothetical protein
MAPNWLVPDQNYQVFEQLVSYQRLPVVSREVLPHTIAKFQRRRYGVNEIFLRLSASKELLLTKLFHPVFSLERFREKTTFRMVQYFDNCV